MGYLGYIIEKYNNINFNFIYRRDDLVYKPKLKNFNLINYDNFIKTLKIAKY